MMPLTPQPLFVTLRTNPLRSIIVDFKVFHGNTSGEAIYNDQVQVLAGYTTKCNLVIGIMDTTGSMGVLGQYLRDNGMQHAYCTDHNLHCNAVLFFNGEYNKLMSVTFLADCQSNIFSVIHFLFTSQNRKRLVLNLNDTQ
jgi:hypothetical protein